MSKEKIEEIIEEIKENIESYMYIDEINAYIKGFLDALCKTHEITWEERTEIEGVLNND